MNLEPLHEELVSLNRNIVTLIGAIAATGTHTPAAPAAPAAPSEAGTGQPSRGGRPKTTYWRLPNGTVVKNSKAEGPANAVEITKAEYEKEPASPTPATGDFFESDEGEITLDDVRTSAFKLRDAKGESVAKGVITKYAPKLADVKPEQFSALKAELDAALNGSDL